MFWHLCRTLGVRNRTSYEDIIKCFLILVQLKDFLTIFVGSCAVVFRAGCLCFVDIALSLVTGSNSVAVFSTMAACLSKGFNGQCGAFFA